MPQIPEIDPQTRTEMEAAAFRTLVQHLRERTDVQNIDLMNLSGFCRNCLSKWYRAAAEERGLDLDYDQAREIVYGMPYDDWKAQYQTEATPDQPTPLKSPTKMLPSNQNNPLRASQFNPFADSSAAC